MASHVQIPRSGEEVTKWGVGRSITERHWRRQRREQLGPAVALSGSGSGRRTGRRKRMSRGMIAMVFASFTSSLCALTAQTPVTSGPNYPHRYIK